MRIMCDTNVLISGIVFPDSVVLDSLTELAVNCESLDEFEESLR